MLRKWVLMGCILWPFGAVLADQPRAPRPLASAIHAAQSGNWERAAQLAERDGQAAEDFIEWTRLRAGLGTAAEVTAFLAGHGHWPGLELLRKRSEAVFDAESDAAVLAFYGGKMAQTGEGVLRQARALMAAGEGGEAGANLVLAWRTFEMSRETQAAFLAGHEELLKPHHKARLEMALWRGLRSDAEQMLELVDPDTRRIAEVRGAFQSGAKDAEALYDALPKAMRADAGLGYDRFNRIVQTSSAKAAIEAMLERSTSAEALGQPERWGSWRRNLARGQMREGNARLAYQIATTHHLAGGSDYADLEWLAGYIALRKLKDPKLALAHFQNFRAAVFSPISVGRAGYWLGLTHEALGDAEAAMAAFRLGAQHQSSFYGLLAAEKAGVPPDRALAGVEYFGAWQQADWAKSDLVKVVELALAMDDLSLAEQFFRHLGEAQDRRGLGQMGDMAMDLGAPHMAVMLGKDAAQREITLEGPYYPLHPMAEMDLPVPMELALAIARRESEFDPGVVSGVGAMGLMQLMPGTASDVARDLGLEHDRSRVLSDWHYNAVLGSAYLAGLGKRFDGNIVMVAAGYNAGPGRPLRWMEEYGDPRTGAIDVVDWIEMIPFRETQNYVMRVAESLPIYRARLGKNPLPVPFSKELVGKSVLPVGE